MNRLAVLLAPLVLFASIVVGSPSVDAAIDNSPDCETVAIIKCGAFSANELRRDATKGDVAKVFSNFGISTNELNGFVDGVVYKDGSVTIGKNEVVARNAVTAGRWDSPKSGMTKIPGTNKAYRMSTSNFVDEGQTAFIKMVNGKFSFAVIKSCGNPVTAKPVDKPKPPRETPPTPIPPTPTPTPSTPTPPQSTPPAIPDTGTGDIIGLLISTVAGGTFAHRFVWLRRPQ